MTNQNFNRRNFLKRSGGTVAMMSAPMFLSSKAKGANDKIGLGFIGTGRRAGGLKNDFGRLSDARIVAVSDLDTRKMKHFTGDNDWAQIKDFRKLLERDDVDAIVTATPDHWHALVSIYSNMAGKDVYVEKPMTLTIAEGRAMVEAARKFDRVVQCGSQQRSDRRSRIGCALVRNNRIGKVKVAHADLYHSPWEQPFPAQPVPEGLDWDTWVGPVEPHQYNIDIYTPRRYPGWISLVPFSGGEVTGWGAHGIDMIQWALGMDDTMPVEIWAEGNTRDLNRVVNMKYANGVLLKVDGKGPAGGGYFEGEDGTLTVDRGRYEINPKENDIEDESELEIQLEKSNNHQQNFLDCVKSREKPIADVEIGHRSTAICHFINIARWTHRKMEWDPVKEKFVNDEDANAYLDRPRREPWGLPKI